MKTLILFDIDGTLLTCGGVPRTAITQAVEEVFGTRGRIDQYPFSGKSDTRIIYDVMTDAGMDPHHVRHLMPAALERYVQLLDERLLNGHVKVLNGVVALLEHLAHDARAVVGLLTGNIPHGARIKLERAGLSRYFFNGHQAIGAFGSDSMERSELATLAVQRATAATGNHFKEKQIVIIGDSPYDVECGRHLNARSVAVATGWHSADELALCKPDYLLQDLSDTSAVLQSILE